MRRAKHLNKVERYEHRDRIAHGFETTAWGTSVLGALGGCAIQGFAQMEQLPRTDSLRTSELIAYGVGVFGVQAANFVRGYRSHLDRLILQEENNLQPPEELDLLTDLGFQS